MDGNRMPEYRIYIIDGCGKVARSFEFEGHDDLAALDKANAIRRAEAAEIWERMRLVARLDTHGDAAEGLS